MLYGHFGFVTFIKCAMAKEIVLPYRFIFKGQEKRQEVYSTVIIIMIIITITYSSRICWTKQKGCNFLAQLKADKKPKFYVIYTSFLFLK